ncbi:helix-turn-helix domain-containing protein [Haloechinothrix halophila]|uniref:helix-turn-helix domain-containing protein n=1 Tax=Haloechinothrix halophila TaxID=1069073 RepID=UPI0003F79FB0|nr:helix-turn-helix transcriptional regulator [Haloechinothrix halophila]
MTVLLREAIGDRLRHARTNQRRTLREISHSARVSLGYLSEVERGQKEASSELLAAICDALELPLPELLNTVATDMASVDDMVLDGEISGSECGDGAETAETVSGASSGAGGMSTALRTTIASPTVRVFAA